MYIHTSLSQVSYSCFFSDFTQTKVSSAFVGDCFDLWINSVVVSIYCRVVYVELTQINYNGYCNGGTCHPVQTCLLYSYATNL